MLTGPRREAAAPWVGPSPCPCQRVMTWTGRRGSRQVVRDVLEVVGMPPGRAAAETSGAASPDPVHSQELALAGAWEQEPDLAVMDRCSAAGGGRGTQQTSSGVPFLSF